jgi:hypothetical protein
VQFLLLRLITYKRVKFDLSTIIGAQDNYSSKRFAGGGFNRAGFENGALKMDGSLRQQVAVEDGDEYGAKVAEEFQ